VFTFQNRAAEDLQSFKKEIFIKADFVTANLHFLYKINYSGQKVLVSEI
jgi:hypothetical protein